MRSLIVKAPWSLALLPVLAAIPFALFLSLKGPSSSLLLIAGGFPLLLAFISPQTGLYLLVFSMLLGPEFLVGGLGSGATLGRGVTLRFDDFLLMLVGMGWLARAATSEHEKVFVRTPLNRAITWYVVACIFATLLGILFGRVRPMGGMFFLLKYYEYFFLYFMTVNLIKDEKQVRHLVIASLVTCFLVSLYAISQIPSGERVSAPFEGRDGEPNTLGGYLVFIMAIVGGLVATPGAVPKKWPYFVLMGVAGIALQATLSRASFLAAGVVTLGFLLMLRRRSPILVSLLLMGILAVPLLAPRAVVDRVMYTFAQPKEEGQIQVGKLRVDTSTSERLRSWQQSLEVWTKSPLWGMGVTGGPFMDAMYPRVLTEAGLLGICAFFALLWAIARTSVGAFAVFRDPYLTGLTLGFLMGFVGLLVHAVGSNTFIIVRIMEPFWLYAGIIVKCLLLRSRQDGTRVSPDTGDGPSGFTPSFPVLRTLPGLLPRRHQA